MNSKIAAAMPTHVPEQPGSAQYIRLVSDFSSMLCIVIILWAKSHIVSVHSQPRATFVSDLKLQDLRDNFVLFIFDRWSKLDEIDHCVSVTTSRTKAWIFLHKPEISLFCCLS